MTFLFRRTTKEKDIAKLESVQRAAARFVHGKPHRRYAEAHDSVTAMLDQLGWPSLQQRRASSRISLMGKILTKKVAIPEAYHPSSSYEGYTRATKRSASKGELPYLTTTEGHTERYRNTFMPRTVWEWNHLPKGTGFSLPDASAASNH